MRLTICSSLAWLILFALAAANGALREFVMRPLIGAAALPLSGLTLIALHALAIWLFVRWAAPSLAQAWIIGIGWLALTLAAETLMTMRAGKPASDVLAAVSWPAIAGGNLVVLAYIFVAVAPALFAWWLSASR